MRFKDIPHFTRPPSYRVELPWNQLERWIEEHQNEYKSASLDLDPDFQRDYVWTEEQKTRYIEYILKGGQSGREIYFNCAGWMGNFQGPFVIVDGKQRLNAVRQFFRNQIKAFGYYFNEFEDRIPSNAHFNMCVNDLPTRERILQWYLDLNTGGTSHTDEELNKVRAMMEKIND
jgi:hypothetical protein